MAITTLNLRGINRSDTATSGQVITATSAVAADFQDAGGGMWTKIKHQTITSATASMDFVDGTSDVVLDGTYEYYMIMFRNAVNGTSDKILQVLISTDTGSTWETTGYKSFGYQAAYEIGQTARQNRTTTFTVMNSCPHTAGEGMSGWIVFTSPATAIKPSCFYNITAKNSQHSDGMNWTGGGIYDTATTFDGIRFIPNTGTITTLQATLYGHTD